MSIDELARTCIAKIERQQRAQSTGRFPLIQDTSGCAPRFSAGTRFQSTSGGRIHCKRSEEHTSELQSRQYLVCRLLLEKKKNITRIILIKLIRVSLGTVRNPRRFKIVVIDIQITLKQMLRDFIGIRVNRAKKSGMVNITSSVNSRERSGINTILHELNPLFTINVTMRDI